MLIALIVVLIILMITSTAVLLYERYWLKKLIDFIQEHNTSLMTKNKAHEDYNKELTGELKKIVKRQQKIEDNLRKVLEGKN